MACEVNVKYFAYTDYPMSHLGDLPGVKAPFRMVEVLSYDGDKYVTIRDSSDNLFDVKRWYLYAEQSADKVFDVSMLS